MTASIDSMLIAASQSVDFRVTARRHLVLTGPVDKVKFIYVTQRDPSGDYLGSMAKQWQLLKWLIRQRAD